MQSICAPPQAKKRGLKWMAALVIISALAGYLAACASSRGAIDVEQFKGDPSTSATPEYIIRIGDLLSVQVYSDEKASGRTRVRTDGRISLPLLNDIEAAGKTPIKLAADIETSLKALLVNPRVTVSVEESTPLSISVLGEVTKPGSQTLLHDAGVADALAAAGGLTRFAHKDRIYVVRTKPEPVRIHFTYEALTRSVGSAPLFRLRAGDVVVVE
jgi:polysaccharide export outer membrane protein